MVLELSQFGDLTFLLLRLAIGAIFVYHSLPKLRAAAAAGAGMGLPTGVAFTLGLAELLGGLGVALGFYIQLAALLLAIVMIGALYFKLAKWHVPFSAMDKMGWEFDLILLAVSLFLLVHGGGSMAIQ